MPVGKWLYMMHGKTRPGDRAIEFFEANDIDFNNIVAGQYVQYDHDTAQVTVNEYANNLAAAPGVRQKVFLNPTWDDGVSPVQVTATYDAPRPPEQFGFTGLMPRTVQEKQDERRGSGEHIREWLISQGWTPPGE